MSLACTISIHKSRGFQERIQRESDEGHEPPPLSPPVSQERFPHKKSNFSMEIEINIENNCFIKLQQESKFVMFFLSVNFVNFDVFYAYLRLD